MIAIRDNTNLKMIAMHIDEEHEQMWVKVNEYVIGIVYGMIESRTEKSKIEEWYYVLEKQYVKYQDRKVMIIGDINAHIGNDEYGVYGNSDEISHGGQILRNMTERRNLTIMNNEKLCKGKWTREDRSNKTKSIHDLVIANENMADSVNKMEIDEDHQNKLTRIRRSNI